MTTLRTPLSREETRRVLSSTLREMHGPEASLERWAEHPVSRRGRHRLARYDLDARVGDSLHHYQWVGKFYEDDDVARRVATVLREAAATNGHGDAALVIPGVVAYHSPHGLLLLTFEEGQTVVSALARHVRVALPALGRALAALHAVPVRLPGTTTPAAVLADLRDRVDDLGAMVPSERRALQHVYATLEQKLPAEPRSPTFLHGDLGPVQLRWRAGKIIVLDFDACTSGDPALDLGNLLTQLRRLTLRKPDKLEEFHVLRMGLLGAYRRWAPNDPDLLRRVAWYEQAASLRKIHFLIFDRTRHRQPEAIQSRRVEAEWLLQELYADCDTSERPALLSSAQGWAANSRANVR